MTRLSLSRAELQALNPCAPDRHLARFGKRDRLTARQAVRAGFNRTALLLAMIDQLPAAQEQAA